MYEIDEQQIRQWWQVFKSGNKLVEIRLLGSSTYSGYFKDVDTLISALRPMLDHNNAKYYGQLQAYFTLNDIDEDLYGREQHDRFVKKPKATTTDGNVTRRRFVMLDFDACRVAGVSANDQEFEKAHLKAVEVYRYLMEQGFKEPIITTSGNGWHEYLTCDMPNDDEHNELIKNFLKSLGSMFSDEYVEIDEKVYNPARVDKMIGSWAKKGSDTQDRKWRLARIVKVPQDLAPNGDELFRKVADLLPKEEPKPAPSRQPNRQYSNTPFDLESWLRQYNIEYKVQAQGSSTKYVLRHCPWEDTHSSVKEYESALFVDSNGKITFSCFHSHCKDKTWQDYRLHYQPDAYDKPAYQPQVVYVQAPPQKQPPRLKKDDFDVSEDGVVKRWKRMKDIHKVNLLDIPHYRTGFTELDKVMKGLFEGDVTIISGLNSSGKSSWLNSVVLNLIEQNVRVAMWSGELPEIMLKSWIQMVAAGRRNLTYMRRDDYWFVPDGTSARIDMWMDDKLLLFDNDYPPEWSLLLSDMEVLAKQGVKVFVLDNLMSMSIDIVNGSNNEKQTALIKTICNFAKKFHCHIILVAHPRKATGFLRKVDISGTSDLTNLASNVLIVHRVNNDFRKLGADFFGQSFIAQFFGFGNVVEVCKNRIMGAQDRLCGMYYEIESRRFKNTPEEDVRYGWETMSEQQEMQYTDYTQHDEDPFGQPLEDLPF